VQKVWLIKRKIDNYWFIFVGVRLYNTVHQRMVLNYNRTTHAVRVKLSHQKHLKMLRCWKKEDAV